MCTAARSSASISARTVIRSTKSRDDNPNEKSHLMLPPNSHRRRARGGGRRQRAAERVESRVRLGGHRTPGDFKPVLRRTYRSVRGMCGHPRSEMGAGNFSVVAMPARLHTCLAKRGRRGRGEGKGVRKAKVPMPAAFSRTRPCRRVAVEKEQKMNNAEQSVTRAGRLRSDYLP